jgi:hypothetical protein
MNETSEAYKRGWNACLAGRALVLGIEGDSMAFADGYIDCMKAHLIGSATVTSMKTQTKTTGGKVSP